MLRRSTNVSRYQGDLIVVLDSGMELTLPNELLIVPEKMIDDSGKVYANTSVAEIMIQPTIGNGAADTPVVGKQFFSSNYLFVDHDAGTFTVWQANRTMDSRLVAVGGDCNATETQGDPAPVPSTDDGSEATDSLPNDSKATENGVSLSTGAIAGIAGGAAGALAVIAVILFVCLKRRKQRRKRDDRGLLPPDGMYDDQKSDQYYEAEARSARHELHNAATSELAAPREVRELYGDDSKHGFYTRHKSRGSPTVAYELAARSP